MSDLPLENMKNWVKYDDIINYIKDKNNNLKTIELVYNILINNYVFDLIGNISMNNNNNYNNLTLKAKSFLDFIEKINISFPENSKKLINFLINRNEFENKIKSKLKLNLNIPLNENLLYILFFAIKIVIIIQAIPNNIYLNFYSNKYDLIKALSENYFPCCFPQNNELIDSYNEIEEHLRNQPPNYGIYMCSCGKYYTVNPCGFPTQTSNCSKCGKKIGGIHHKLERREGHYRIILDEQAKINIIDRGFDRDMPYKLLSELKKEVDSLLNEPYKGIGKISKEKINKTGYNIRNIKELNFRILNFVIYSHLLISNILGILDNNEISQYFSEETNCFDIMILNWNKMQELISQIGINNIQIFMNIIFERIIKIISKYNINSISNEEGRNKIENEFNNCIFIDEIKNEINIYETQNQKILNSSPFNLSSLIQQLYPFSFYTNEERYPYFKYLYLYSLPKSSDISNILNSNNDLKNKYSLTLKVLKYLESDKKEISLLKYLPKVNEKLNHLINSYSYKISRDESAKKTIKEEFYNKNNNIFVINKYKENNDIISYIKDIINLFDEFNKIPLQWGCHQLKNISLKSDSSLSTILLDENEPGYYLASIYKKLIEYQNLFLENIINCNSQNGLLYCFVKQLNNEIMAQDVTFNEIVKLKIKKNNSKLYSDLEEIFFVNISNDPLINKFNYELNQIEIELGNLILPGVRKFKSSDEELRFITYTFEGYRGKNSAILTNFNEKYPQKDLTKNEKEILYNFVKNFAQDEYRNFLFSIQILINYIQNSGKPGETPIFEVFSNIPMHLNIDENIKDIFNLNKNLKIDKLVRIFEFFEHLCWEQIKEYLLDEYLKPLDENKIKEINNYFFNNKNNVISKIELAEAVRKFISRYLAGKRSQSEIGEDKMLFDYLSRADLWKKNINDEKFENEIMLLSKLKITVGEAKDFYDKLGGDNDYFFSQIKNEENIGNNFLDEEDKKSIGNIGNNNEINIIIKQSNNKKKIDDDSSESEEEIVDKKNQNIKGKRNLFI